MGEFKHSRIVGILTLALGVFTASCNLKSAGPKIESGSTAKSVGIDTLDEDTKKLTTRWIQSKTSDEIANIIAEISLMDNVTLAKKSPSFRYLAARAVTLLPLRGIGYRQITLIDNSTASRVQALQVLRNFAGRFGVFFPDMQQQKALFLYVTEPFIAENGKEVAQFKSENEFKSYLLQNVSPALEKSSAILKSIDGETFGWDNRIWYGNQEFKSDIVAVKTITPVEIHAHIARNERALYLLKFGSAYSWDGYMDLVASLNKKMGVDIANAELRGFVDDLFAQDQDNAPKGMTSKDKTMLIKAFIARSSPGPKLFSLQEPQLVNEALAHFKNSVVQIDKAWIALKPELRNDSSRAAVIDPALAKLRDDEIAASVENMKKLIAGPVEVFSSISGRGVSVDVLNFFKNPPTSLTELLPVEFDELGGEFTKLAGTAVLHRNYFWHTPTGWNANAYKKLFPKVNSNTQVAEAIRLLNEVRGGGAFVNTINLAFR